MPNIPQVFGLDANGNKVPLPPAGGGSGRSRAQLNTLDSNVATALANAAAAKALADIQSVSVLVPDITAATVVVIPAPFAGTVLSAAVTPGASPNADIVTTFTIEGQTLTDNVATVTSGALVGVQVGTVPLASGEPPPIGAARAVIATLATANTTAGTATVTVKFSRS